MYRGRFVTTVAAVATIFISLIIIVSNDITTLPVPYSTITFAQISNQDKPVSSDLSFRFAFTKLGVLGGIYQRISYDSQTNALSLNNISAAIEATDSGGLFSSQQASSQSQSNKQISEADENNLKQTIYKNGFFEADSAYPPPNTTRPQNYTLYVLSIKMDDRLHTVLWANTSNNVAPGLLSIVQALQKVASK
jgi:hypothetical protein